MPPQTAEIKKNQQSPISQTAEPVSNSSILAEIDNQITQTLDSKALRYSWMIPLMVIMVVGATIYLSVLDKKIEYVYSLASACFGYYFGTMVPKPQVVEKKPAQPLSGVRELTE